ncbi:hypothetical protein WN51_08976 [Melipona quadrifasciata]|uniref:Uncharacterized protein n=1 Tax=Melipona quadrifasciata TaxID=166423 RepID=A0A0M8ZPW7_9HYME|nr:hypothetical protein WN51_08976 [Melipona quadrifasciata]
MKLLSPMIVRTTTSTTATSTIHHHFFFLFRGDGDGDDDNVRDGDKRQVGRKRGLDERASPESP